MPDSVTGPQQGAQGPQTAQNNITFSGGAVEGVLRVIAGLTNERVLTLVMCGIAGYLIYSVMQHQAEDKAAGLRFAESEATRTQMHCDNQMKENRQFFMEQGKMILATFAEEREKQRRFEAEERAKDRLTLTAMTVEWIKWRELVSQWLKKLPPPDGEDEDQSSGATVQPSTRMNQSMPMPRRLPSTTLPRQMPVNISECLFSGGGCGHSNTMIGKAPGSPSYHRTEDRLTEYSPAGRTTRILRAVQALLARPGSA